MCGYQYLTDYKYEITPSFGVPYTNKEIAGIAIVTALSTMVITGGLLYLVLGDFALILLGLCGILGALSILSYIAHRRPNTRSQHWSEHE